MCGIVGYVGDKDAQNILIDSLKRLEYRGYDSAGIAICSPGKGGKMEIVVQKAKGRIKELEAVMKVTQGTTGICHTRWATHGKPSVENAHPHVDCKGDLALVHNGIIENYMELRDELTKEGHKWRSQTDTEVLCHLIEKYYKGSLENAVRKAVSKVRGAFACVIMHKNEPDRLVCIRNKSPLILGIGVNMNMVASDVPAVLKYTNKIVYLNDLEMAVLTKKDVKVYDLSTGKPLKFLTKEVEWSLEDAQKGGYEHFMIKEIFEQPKTIHNCLIGHIGTPTLEAIIKEDIKHIKFIACGTSFHACFTGKYIFEKLLKIPTYIELASEYRYSEPISEQPLVILVSQSGETADTIAAAREAKRRGCPTIGITNVVGSNLTREVDEVILLRSGPEIGVAATKTYTAQLIAIYLLAIYIGEIKGILSPNEVKILNQDLRSLPRLADKILHNAQDFQDCAQELVKANDVFFIGRNINYPSVMEGALKLKEISYIHAEAYAAGELKHGPISLLSESTPVVAVVLRDEVYEKMVNNIQEVAARSAPVIALVTEGDETLKKYVDRQIYLPATPALFSPVSVSIALQMLAYYTAKARGCPIDQPRNLAKSVTVE